MSSNSNSNMVAPPTTSNYFEGLGDDWDEQKAGGEESPEFAMTHDKTTPAAVKSTAGSSESSIPNKNDLIQMVCDLQHETAQLKDIIRLNTQLEEKRLVIEKQEKRMTAKAKKEDFFKGLLIKAEKPADDPSDSSSSNSSSSESDSDDSSYKTPMSTIKAGIDVKYRSSTKSDKEVTSEKNMKKASKFSKRIATNLKSLSCKKFSMFENISIRQDTFATWIDNVEQACTLEPASVDIFDEYHLKGRIHMLNNEENEKGLYNALRIYVDPSTLKAYDAYRNFGTGLLQRFSKDIVGDRSDNKQKLRKEFDALTIKRHEAPTTFCLRARKKQGEMSRIVEVSDKKVMKQVLRGIGEAHTEWGHVVTTLKERKKLTMYDIEKKFLALEILKPKSDVRAHKVQESAAMASGAESTKKKGSGEKNDFMIERKEFCRLKKNSVYCFYEGYCGHCGRYGHGTPTCFSRQSGYPEVTETVKKSRKLNDEEKVTKKQLILDLEKKHNAKASANKVTISKHEAEIMGGDDSDIQHSTANMVHFGVFHSWGHTESDCYNVEEYIQFDEEEDLFDLDDEDEDNDIENGENLPAEDDGTIQSQVNLDLIEQHLCNPAQIAVNYADVRQGHHNFIENWLVDSGASAHMTPYTKDLHDKSTCKINVILADGSSLTCKQQGKCHLITEDTKQKQHKILLPRVLLIPHLDRRLFSVPSFTCVSTNSVMFKKNTLFLKYSGYVTKITLPAPSTGQAYDVSTLAARTRVTTELLHDRLCAPNAPLLLASKHELWKDTAAVLSGNGFCTDCRIAVIPFTRKSMRPMNTTTKVNDWISVDIVPNPCPTEIIEGYNFVAFLAIVDIYSRRFFLIGLNSESSEEVIRALKEYTARNGKVKAIRSDAGTAFLSIKLTEYCNEEGMEFNASAPEGQNTNGFTEIHWKNIHHIARKMLCHSRLSTHFAHFALQYAARVHDMLPIKGLTNSTGDITTPYELWYKRKPNIKKFRVFGCPAVFKRYGQIKKFDQAGQRGIFLGFPQRQAGWLFYNPGTPRRVLHVSQDAFFDENFNSAQFLPRIPFKGALPLRFPLPLESTFDGEAMTETTGDVVQLLSHDAEEKMTTFDDKDNDSVCSKVDEDESQTSEIDEDETESINAYHIEAFTQQPAFRNKKNSDTMLPTQRHGGVSKIISELAQNKSKIKGATIFADDVFHGKTSVKDFFNIQEELHTSMQATISEQMKSFDIAELFPEPTKLSDLFKLTTDIQTLWFDAVRNEVEVTVKFQVFNPSVVPQPGEKVIPIKMVFKVKTDEHGKLDKVKVRAAVRGDLQKKYSGTLADISPWVPAATSRALRRFLAQAAKKGRPTKQIDYIAAFCQGIMRGRVFVQFPELLAVFLPEYEQYFGVPLLLEKGIYGMTHSGKFFDDDMVEFLTKELGFVQSAHEPALYTCRKKGEYLNLLNYIDDQLYFGSTDSTTEWFEKKLRARFDVEIKGDANWFLSSKITRIGLDYTLDQNMYCNNLLKKFQPPDSTWGKQEDQDNPLPDGIKMSKEWKPKTIEERDSIMKLYGEFNYRGCVGSLIYLSGGTRYDITFAVNKLAKYVMDPGVKHFEALMHLLGYLNKHPNMAIRFYNKVEDSPIAKILRMNHKPDEFPTTVTFSDSSWQDCPDTARSTGSYVIFSHGSMVDYASYMPQPVSMSSPEAEYTSAAIAAMAAAHFRYLDDDFLHLGKPAEGRKAYDESSIGPAVIYTDSQSAVHMTEVPKTTSRTRHIQRKYHYLREGRTRKYHEIYYLSNVYQIADIGTKALAKTPLETMRNYCLVEV